MFKTLTIRIIISTLIVGWFTVVQTNARQPNEGADRMIELRQKIQKAVNSGEPAKLISIKQELKPLLDAENDRLQSLAHYYTAYCNYRISILKRNLSTDQKDAYLEEAIEHLDNVIKQQPNNAEAIALKSSCYGMMIDGMWDGMWYGPKAGNLMEKAVQLAPNNPRVQLMNGISKFNTPSSFGGGKDLAFKAWQQSEQLFNDISYTDSLDIRWGHAEIYAWLGQFYADEGNYAKAKEMFDKGLEVNPQYGWIKHELQPKLAEAQKK